MRMPRVLLSHSSRDKEFVRRLADDLEREGVDVWFDEADLRVGEDLDAIKESIRSSQCLVLVQSRSARESTWVQREIDFAEECGLRILPVVMEEMPVPWGGKVPELATADFRWGYRRALWRLISSITDRPNPLIHAKRAAERVKAEMAVTGELFGLSQQGVATFYSLANRGDWAFADASEGMSRLWIVEIYDRETRSVHPFALMDNEIHELPVLHLLDSDPEPLADSAIIMSCTLSIPAIGAGSSSVQQEDETGGRRISKRYTRYRPIPLTRDFVDSDVAVKSAVEHPETAKRIGGRVAKLFTLTKLEADRVHGNAVLWKVSFFDPSLAESVLTVGVNAVTGEVKYPAMRSEILNANFMHIGERDGQIVLSIQNQIRAMAGHSWDIAAPGDSFKPRLTAADAMRLTASLLGNEPGTWQLAFLSNTGVMKSVVSGSGPTDRLMRVDGTAGQWVVEVCGTTATQVSDGTRTGFEYDFRRILVTREEGAAIVDSPGKCVFTVPLSRCPGPPDFLGAYEEALALALRTVSVDFEELSVAHTRPSTGLQWCFRFYDTEDIVQTIWVEGDGTRVVKLDTPS